MPKASRPLKCYMTATNHRAALQVWIWLGESADGSDCAMDLINNVTTMKSSDPSYQPDRDAWRATNFLFKRPWFTRLWVLQETLFARRATVHCGEKAVDLKMFLHFNDMESMYRRQNDSRLQPILSPMNIIFSDWKRVKSSLTKGKLTLFELISMTGEFKCKKEKDKIFALLSLCTAEERRYFSFDYNLDVPLLMIKVARYFISTRQLQSPMKILQTHQDGKKLSLPSWVPDYTTPDVESHLMIPATKGNTPYKAGADNDAWAGLGLPRLAPEIIRSKCEDAFGPALGRIIGIFLGNVSWTVTRRMNSARVGGGHLDKVLVLSGLKFDIIKFASKMPRVDYYEGTDEKEDRERKRQRRETTIDTCKQWDRHVQTIPSETGPYATPHGRREAYWRSLIADRDFDLKAPPNPSHDFAGRFEAWIGNDEGRAEYARPYSDAAVWRCINRSFVITEKGYLGLAPSGARKGDVISVLRGGYVPFVLRKGDHSDWKLVGEAYVHGIMDGSWVREAAKEDVMEFRMT